ncbi:major facilitator superfamily domain-containing protein 8-like [Convolutriloba macropyga]|uniref:major facilitator superfamily domain-containing protein 8-like n=1 Tax=Convolutriloba macropyga TaxID=536237 RepID=UPI003F528BAD
MASPGDAMASSSGSTRKRMLSMWTLYLTSFIGATGYSIIMSSGYPYLQQIDPDATTKFYGWVVGSFSLGQFFGSPLMGIASNTIGYMLPFQFCLVMMCIGHTVYGYLDALSSDVAPFVMVGARFVIGIGSGNIAIVRSFASVTTTMEERTAVLTNISAAQALGFVAGPLLQTLFVPIGEKGYELSYVRFTISMYTAPAFLSAFLACINLILFWVFFTDATTVASRGIFRRRPRPIIIHDYATNHNRDSGSSFTTIDPNGISSFSYNTNNNSNAVVNTISNETLWSGYARNSGPATVRSYRRISENTMTFDNETEPDSTIDDYRDDNTYGVSGGGDRVRLVTMSRDGDRDNLALCLSIYLWIVVLTTFSFYETLVTPILEVMMAWTPGKATLVASILFAVCSFVTLFSMGAVRVLANNGFKERYVLICAMVLLTISFLGVLPYSPDHPKVYYPDVNSSTTESPDERHGCDSTKYSWCHSVHQIYLFQFIISAVFNCMGYAGAVVLVATLFSKIVGPFPQGFLQGILTAGGSFARALGPLAVTQLFDNFGPLAAYLSQAASCGLATFIVIIFNRRFIQHILTREFGVSY